MPPLLVHLEEAEVLQPQEADDHQKEHLHQETLHGGAHHHFGMGNQPSVSLDLIHDRYSFMVSLLASYE